MTAIAFLLAAAIPQDTTGVGSLAGTIVDAASQPGSGLRVCALGTPTCATSDQAGRFRLADLRAGSYRLEIIPASGLPVQTEAVTVRAGLEATIAVTLPRADQLTQSVTVTASSTRVPDEVKTSGFLVEPREVIKGAGALQDVSRAVQSLPGVVIGSNDFRNDIIVRGGSPLENLFVVDNVEVPNINTFANFASAGGTVSILDAELLQDVTFLTGGYPAPYINRTSSVLQVTQREGNRGGFRGAATLGFAGAGAILEGPIAGGRGSWIASARRSFLDLFTDDIGVGGVPVLYTFNGKVVYDVSPRDRVWAVTLSGIDRIRLGLTEGDLTDTELDNFDIRYEGWRTATGFNWQRLFGQRAVGLLGVTHSEASVGQQVKDLVRDGVPSPDTPVDDVIASSPIVYAEQSTEGETTVKYDLTATVPWFDKIQAGGSVKVFRIRYDAEAPYGSDSPYSVEPGRDAFDISTRFHAAQTGAYLQASRAVTSRVNLTVGGRFDRFHYIDQNRISPRIAASVRLANGLTWNASTGLYYQQPAFLFLSAFPENRALKPWRAVHYVTGVAWQPPESGLRVTVEAYRKTYRDYPVALEYPSVSLANVGDTFNVREILFPLTDAGRGSSEGLEVFVEKKLTSKVYGQANVSVSRTRHAGLDGIQRPGSFDYPAVLNLTGGYVVSPSWEVSTRVSALSGRPYTPYDEALSTAQRRGIYDLRFVNAGRLPAYVRVDVRVDRTFTIAGQPFVLFAGVQNVTNRSNTAGYQWNRRDNTVQVSDQQGLFPILGFNWQF